MFFKSDKDKAADKLNEAKSHVQANRLGEGLKLLYEAGKLDAQANTFFMIGKIEQMMMNNAGAVEAYKQSTALDANDHEAWGRMAACLVELNRFDEAQQSIQGAFTVFQQKNQPVPPPYQAVARGISLLKARLDAEKEFKANPQTPVKMASLPDVIARSEALKTLISQDGAAALNGLEALVKEHPNVPELLLWHGLIVGGLGYIEWAMKDFTRAICLDATYVQAYTERARLWVMAGRFPEILSDTEKILQLEADNIEAIILRAQGYELQGDKPAANRENEKLLKMDLSQHSNPKMLLQQGNIFFQYKRFDEALKVYGQVLARPNLPADVAANAYYAQAKLLINLSRQSEAVDSASKAVELMPHVPDFCHILGEAGKQAGRKDVEIRGWEAYIAAVKGGAQGFLPLYVAENFLRDAQAK